MNLVLPLFDKRIIGNSDTSGSRDGLNPLNADVWFGITSANWAGDCGHTTTFTLQGALSGTNSWVHAVNEVHWFILDLGNNYNITQIRGRSITTSDPTLVTVYVSQINGTWGVPVATDIATWRGTSAWVVIDSTNKIGRWIYVTVNDTEDTIANSIQWGNATGTMSIFDVYGSVYEVGNSAPTQSGVSPTNNSINKPVNPNLYVICSDVDTGDTMNVTWYSNSSGSWIDFATNTSISTGINITQPTTNFSMTSTKYWWSVNLTDGMTNWDNETYCFTTVGSLNPPTVFVINPVNGSIDVDWQPLCQIWANDTDSSTLNVNWYENSSGVWELKQTNNSVSANSIVEWWYENANADNVTYWWNVTVNDGSNTTGSWNYFTVKYSRAVTPDSDETDEDRGRNGYGWFGYKQETTTGSLVLGRLTPSPYNYIHGNRFLMNNTDATADYIMVKLLASNYNGGAVKCMLYLDDDTGTSNTLVGTTETIWYNSSTNLTERWVQFNFVGTKPTLQANHYYNITAWGKKSTSGYIYIRYITANYIRNYDVYVWNPPYNPPNPFVRDATAINQVIDIYCAYTAANTSPTNIKGIVSIKTTKDNYSGSENINLTGTVDGNVYTIYSGSTKTAQSNGHCIGRQSNGTLVTTFLSGPKEYICNSEDNGTTWNTLYSYLNTDQGKLAIDSNDTIHVISYDDSDHFRYLNSTDWSINIIDSEVGAGIVSDIVIDSNDKIHIVYEKDTEGASNSIQVAYMNSTNGGKTWSSPKILTNEVNADDNVWYPSIAINKTNSIHVVFQCLDYANNKDQILHIKSDNGGITWSSWIGDVVTSDTLYDQDYPVMVIDDNDTIHIAWIENFNTGLYSYNNGSWSAEETCINPATVGFDGLNALTISRSDDYIYVLSDSNASGGAKQKIIGAYRNSISWNTTSIVTGYTGASSPHLIYGYYPINNSEHTNIPSSGYCFIYINGSTGLNYCSSNAFSWINNSKIKNIGNTGITGYLFIDVEYNNSGNWVNVTTTIDETTTRTIMSGSILKLDTFFNGNVLGNNLTYGSGQYRIYSAFRDVNRSVIQNTDGSYMNDSYIFNYTSTYTPPGGGKLLFNYSFYWICNNASVKLPYNISSYWVCNNASVKLPYNYSYYWICNNVTPVRSLFNVSSYWICGNVIPGKILYNYSYYWVCGNISEKILYNYSYYWILGNTSTYKILYNYSNYWICNNGSSRIITNISSYWVCGNTSVEMIIISNIYPGNNSFNIPLQPVLYATVNHSGSSLMNVSWYYGNSLTNCNTLLGQDLNITNSTQYELYFNASKLSTYYYWQIQANDGTNYVNETYYFKTEGYSGGYSYTPPSNSLWVLSLFGLIGMALWLISRKRKKKKEYY